MPEIGLADVRQIIGSVLRQMPAETSGEDQLSALGVDSLTMMNVILAAAEQFGLDLERLEETAAPPVTVDDLLLLLRRLQGPEPAPGQARQSA